MKQISLCFWVILYSFSAVAQSIVYVTTEGSGNHSGTSWANAISGTQFPGKLAVAAPGTQFWVKAGMYTPTTTTDRTASFSITSGVSLYGGFLGNETSLDQRVRGIQTYLTGDIGVPNFNLDNSIHVLTIENASDTIIIDGFLITAGYIGNTDSIHNEGAGIWVGNAQTNLNLILSNCALFDNVIDVSWSLGGAIFVWAKQGTSVNLTVSDCNFFFNKSGDGGAIAFSAFDGGHITSTINSCDFTYNWALNAGAITYNYISNYQTTSISINKSNFFGNSAVGPGGAIVLGRNKCSLTDCKFIQNSVTNDPAFGLFGWQPGGGAIEGSGSIAAFTNCLFTGNKAPYGGVIYSISNKTLTQQTFTNCTFAQDTALVSGGVFYNLLFREYIWTGINYYPLLLPNQTILKNCIVWQNIAPDAPVYKSQFWISPENDIMYNQFRATYSLIQDGYPGLGNQSTDPLFVNANVFDLDFRLKPGSPAINAGDPNTTGLPPYDIAGQPRVQRGRVDMGAFEFTGCTVCPPYSVQKVKR